MFLFSVWDLWLIILCKLFNAKSISIQIITLLQTTDFSMSFIFQAILFCQTSLIQKILIQTIQFSVSTVSMQKQFNFKLFNLA